MSLAPRRTPDIERVGALLRQAAAEHILPRYRQLGHAEVHEKTPGELVTIADLDTERWLTRALTALWPGSQVIGEEAVAARPELLEQIDLGDVWLLDPIDGTRNFVAGHGPFAVMLALLRNGETLASWVLDPQSDELLVAERGAGAYANGQRLQVAAAQPGPPLGGIVRTRYMPPDLRAAFESRPNAALRPLPGTGSAGADYPQVIRGEPQFALYWRTLPWDHAPCLLLLAEAGGTAARLDGSAYRASDPRAGLLIARDRASWRQARAALQLDAGR